VRDAVSAIDKAITAAVKTLIAAIKIVLVVVAVIVLAIVVIVAIVGAIYLIVAAIYLVAAALAVVVGLVAFVAELTAPLWGPALVKALIRRVQADRLYRYNRDVLKERPNPRPTKPGSAANEVTNRIAAANRVPNALKSPMDREYLELANGAYGRELPIWMQLQGCFHRC
jgi:hypothetical protein